MTRSGRQQKPHGPKRMTNSKNDNDKSGGSKTSDQGKKDAAAMDEWAHRLVRLGAPRQVERHLRRKQTSTFRE
jgi:hypothetical protein